jgi:hypothetical protein
MMAATRWRWRDRPRAVANRRHAHRSNTGERHARPETADASRPRSSTPQACCGFQRAPYCRTTVAEYLRRASAVGITWPMPGELDDAALEQRLFSPPFAVLESPRPQPDWARLHAELCPVPASLCCCCGRSIALGNRMDTATAVMLRSRLCGRRQGMDGFPGLSRNINSSDGRATIGFSRTSSATAAAAAMAWIAGRRCRR